MRSSSLWSGLQLIHKICVSILEKSLWLDNRIVVSEAPVQILTVLRFLESKGVNSDTRQKKIFFFVFTFGEISFLTNDESGLVGNLMLENDEEARVAAEGLDD